MLTPLTKHLVNFNIICIVSKDLSGLVLVEILRIKYEIGKTDVCTQR